MSMFLFLPFPDKKEAAVKAISKSALSILTSASILTVVGYIIYFTSSIRSISQVGHMVGRGALLSMALVLILLPALLSFFDKIIIKQIKRSEEKKQRKLMGKNSNNQNINTPQA